MRPVSKQSVLLLLSPLPTQSKQKALSLLLHITLGSVDIEGFLCDFDSPNTEAVVSSFSPVPGSTGWWDNLLIDIPSLTSVALPHFFLDELQLLLLLMLPEVPEQLVLLPDRQNENTSSSVSAKSMSTRSRCRSSRDSAGFGPTAEPAWLVLRRTIWRTGLVTPRAAWRLDTRG